MSEKVLQTLGQRIVAARYAYKPHRISQRELAQRIGISSKSLNLIESGDTIDPRSSIVRNLSEVLGVSADWLLKGNHEEIDSVGKRQARGEAGSAAIKELRAQRLTKRSRTTAKAATP